MLKKIIFMGTPFFAVPILKSLYQNGYSVSVVYTQPPQKSQRGQKINKSPIQEISETLKIECRMPNSLKNNKEEYNYLKRLDADIAIVVAYGKIIPKEYLSLVKEGFINIHASLLPKWRGAAPIQRSIMNLEKETGISIMRIGEKLDTGPVCNSYKIEIMTNDNTETISEKLSALAAEKILDNIDKILEGKTKFKEQNHDEASYAAKIEKTEGQIEWSETAENIIGKIN
jgi:methionyl-tRNA formyltransferase